MADDTLPLSDEEAKAAKHGARLAKRREWAKANRDRINARQREAYQNQAPEAKQQLLGKKLAYYEANRDTYLPKMRERARREREENPEEVNARKAAQRQANLEQARATMNAWHKANPHAQKVSSSKRRARKKAAEGSFTKADIDALYVAQEGLCVYCDALLGRDYHVDHKTPLARGGSNWPTNLQLTCQPCNQRKGARTHEEFVMRLASLVGAD